MNPNIQRAATIATSIHAEIASILEATYNKNRGAIQLIEQIHFINTSHFFSSDEFYRNRIIDAGSDSWRTKQERTSLILSVEHGFDWRQNALDAVATWHAPTVTMRQLVWTIYLCHQVGHDEAYGPLEAILRQQITEDDDIFYGVSEWPRGSYEGNTIRDAFKECARRLQAFS